MRSYVLSITDIADLRDLTIDNFPEMQIANEEFDHIFRLCKALWLHSGDPSQPHAELTSGLCSNGFVDVLRVIKYTNLCEIFAKLLVQQLYEDQEMYDWEETIDWVVGSDHAGADFSHSVAIALNAQHDFTEKGPDGQQLWKRFTVEPHENVLQVEELITTSKTLNAVEAGIRAFHAHEVKIFPTVLVLVNRSGSNRAGERPVVSLRDYSIQTWKPEACPLCAQGSKRLKPKHNWAALTAVA